MLWKYGVWNTPFVYNVKLARAQMEFHIPNVPHNFFFNVHVKLTFPGKMHQNDLFKMKTHHCQERICLPPIYNWQFTPSTSSTEKQMSTVLSRFWFNLERMSKNSTALENKVETEQKRENAFGKIGKPAATAAEQLCLLFWFQDISESNTQHKARERGTSTDYITNNVLYLNLQPASKV